MISGDVGVVKGIDGPFALTLRELSKYWDHIQVLCPGMLGSERQFNDKVHLKGVRKFLLFFDLIKILRQEKFDLVVSHDYGLMLNGLSAFFALRFFNIPQVSEIHHLEGFPISTSPREKFYAWWGKIYIRFFVSQMRAVRVDNLGAIVGLLKELTVQEKNIVYLPPIYLDLEIYKPIAVEKKYDVLFVGRLAQNKGIFTILETVKNLSHQGIKLKTNIKGRGPLRPQIISFLEKNYLSDLVTLDDRILDETELAQLYNQAKVLVCASTVEGGPRVTLEAMACGIPVITTACGIMPEVIVRGENGYLFDGTSQDLEVKLKHVLISKLSSGPHLNVRPSILKYDLNLTLKSYGLRYLELAETTSY